jgi:hypothetical protein
MSDNDRSTYLHDRLNETFSGLKPEFPEDEDDDTLGTTDDFLRNLVGPDEWKQVEAHRQRLANQAVVDHTRAALMEAYNELRAAGVEVSWDSLRSAADDADRGIGQSWMSDEDRATARRERHTVIANDVADQARARYEADLRESLSGLDENGPQAPASPAE